MNQQLIFLPLLAQILLTAIVSFRLYYTRVEEMKSKRIHPQKIATASSLSQHLTESVKASDNFSNLFEMPVLFYVLILALYVTSLASPVFMTLTSVYVALRYVHSFIHCSYNKVLHRFYVFIASTLLLWATWVLFSFQLLQSTP